MDQLNLSDGEDLPQEILEKMKKMPVPDELLNFLGMFEQFDAFSSILMIGSDKVDNERRPWAATS